MAHRDENEHKSYWHSLLLGRGMKWEGMSLNSWKASHFQEGKKYFCVIFRIPQKGLNNIFFAGSGVDKYF